MAGLLALKGNLTTAEICLPMKTWNEKVVVVTGGSDGLGLEIAKAFASRGGKVVLLARNETRLKSVCEDADLGTKVEKMDWLTCDVTNDGSVKVAVDEIIRRHGRIDVWVNNVGASTRIKFEDCGVEDYRSLMELNFYSSVRCTQAALSALVKTSGQVVNIGSLAAKTGWRNVSPYSASKHALAAFSHQFRLEGPPNVNCLFVCPGPIQRKDAGTRYANQAENMDAAAAQPGAGVKLKGIPPAKLALRIVRACELRKREIVTPWFARLLFSISQLSPVIGDFLLGRFSKKK
jgi:short-subunit dehydrogenase